MGKLRWMFDVASILGLSRPAVFFLLSAPLLLAEPQPPIDESKLPAPATQQIDFARDVKPIFDASCLRCHSSTKPKSGFRLDNRESALKGGDNGIDIVPGNSAKSPLIHFTTGLVSDMEMPPPGKGQPLTPEQIGLLRAWIDQGAPWGTLTPVNSSTVSLSPIFGGTSVGGDNHKFRELNWRREGPYGGLADFDLTQQPNADTTLDLYGHVLPQDYQVALSLDRNDIGFIHSGVDQYRKYYDNTGGYRPSPSTPLPLSLNKDLYVDIGKAWVDFGLTLPNWPRMVLGYEYDYKRGTEATTSWGAAGIGVDERNLAPTFRNIDEHTHVVKFDLDGEFHGVTVEDRFRGEFYALNTSYTNLSARSSVAQSVAERDHYFQGANTIRLEKQFKDWLFGSAGYLYSHLDADANFTNVTTAFRRTFAGSIPDITLERESHIANVNALVGPFDGLTVSAGAQSEWTRQNGFGSGNLNEFPFTRVIPNNLSIVPTTLSANYDENTTMENMTARFTKIPFTVLFLDIRFEQDHIGQITSDLQPTGDFLENVDYSSQLRDMRLGFSTSPWRSVSFTMDYRRYENDSQYPTDQPPQPVGGYPDYFRSRELMTDEVETKLVLRPCNWFKTTLSYEFVTTDYRADANPAFNPVTHVVYSPGGELLTGRTESQIYSASAIFTPHPRVYLSGSFSYQPSNTRNADSSNPAVGLYRGDIYTADASGTYVLSQTTDLTITGFFSDANYGQGKAIAEATVPVDITYQEYGIQAGLTRRFSKNLSGSLQYGFNYYHEPTSANINDFRAHTVFAMLNFRWP